MFVRNKKILHLIPLIIWPFVASKISLSLNLHAFLWSIILFVVVPSLYLSFLLPKSINKSALFSLVAGLPISIIIDYILHINHQWFVPTIFPIRIFELVPIEDTFWGFFSVYFVIMFFEYFLESHKERKVWNPKMKILAIGLISALLIFCILYFTNTKYLLFAYAYFWLCFFFIFIPPAIESLRKPELLFKFLVVGIYFFFFNIIYEITALKLGWWHFNGNQYIGQVSLFGVQFPFEEFFFWIILFSTAVLSYYEPFDDDEK